MKKNLFEIGAKFDDSWSSDNKQKPKKVRTTETKEPNKHALTIAKEKRRGKTVTIIKEFFLEPKELKELFKKIKKKLGCGGTIKASTIELQGDTGTTAKEILQKEGFRFKK